MRRASNQLLGNETMRQMAPYQRAEAAQLLWEFANQSDVRSSIPPRNSLW